jgi:phosphatidylethanolamine/phosphatidyl-N-methylethanolamine N-methyltransferase
VNKNWLTRNYYDNQYKNIHYKGLLGLFTNGYHSLIESHCEVQKRIYPEILEVGGNSGEHIPFVESNYAKYVLTDIEDRVNPKLTSFNNGRIQFQIQNVENLTFQDNSFDRVISTCLLHHLNSVEDALLEMRRVTRNGGLISLYLPCDPGMLYRLVRHVFSHLKQARQANMNMRSVKYLWSVEHKNHFLGIFHLIEGIYRNDHVHFRRYPFPIVSWNFNLFFIFQIEICK